MGIGEGELFGVNKLPRWANSDILKQANTELPMPMNKQEKCHCSQQEMPQFLFGQEWNSSVCSTFAFHIDKHKKQPDIEKSDWQSQ